jgi:predicted SAM-dependent methyltransferase
MEGGLKLHLGCGGQSWEGFVDIDAYPSFTNKPDVIADITDLPYDENTVDEIWLIHVFEHLYLWDAEDAIAHWHKMLRKGGKLVIEVPCMDKIIDNYNRKAKDPRLTILGIFGEQLEGQPEMVHKWCYTKDSLKGMFKRAGFDTTIKDPVYHLKQRDMRVEGTKL